MKNRKHARHTTSTSEISFRADVLMARTHDGSRAFVQIPRRILSNRGVRSLFKMGVIHLDTLPKNVRVSKSGSLAEVVILLAGMRRAS